MSVIYKFKNLDELAAYINNKGREIAGQSKLKLKEAARRDGEAYAHTCIANMLSNTILEFESAIGDALGTAERGEALIEVARNAHKAEQRLASIETARD